MLALKDCLDVYCDGLSTDDGYLVFASLWGRDTAIQELLARLTLPSSEGGLKRLEFDAEDHDPLSLHRYADVGDPERLDKMTGRMPKTNLFGDIVHLWLFDKRVKQPDYSNHHAYQLFLPGQDHLHHTDIAWALVKEVSHLPLLEHWRDDIIELLKQQHWLDLQEGYRVHMLKIDLPESEFEQAITRLVHSGRISIHPVSEVA